MYRYLLVIVLLFAAWGDALFSRPHRVNQIPNGTVFQCANCHVNPAGGGTRTAFGKAIETGYLDSNGTVVWQANLAQVDSDGDGGTNGEELQDPEGAWIIGAAAPGQRTLVTNPGDPLSTAVQYVFAQKLPDNFQLYQNFPNPFNPTTEIRFSIAKTTLVNLQVFNMTGQLVKTLVDETLVSGEYKTEWNGTDLTGQPVPSGIYFYQLTSERFSEMKRMALVR